MSRNDAFRSAADTLDTAMVGAGVGGLYTTWRLLGCGQPPDGIGVFEATERVGGRLFSVSMPGTGIAKKQPIPYWLRADELYLDPFELIVKAVQQVMPAIKHLEPNERAKTKGSLTLDGRAMIKWGFCNLLSRFLSDEALQFIQMSIGYSSVMPNRNAADALSLVVEYISSPTEKTLVDSMRALPDSLAAAVESDRPLRKQISERETFM